MIARFFARRGARMLDRAAPGWATRVNPAVLDIAAWYCCVLGQLYGSYVLGKIDLGINGIQCIWYGFVPLLPGYSSWRKLTAAWVEEIKIRTPEPASITAGDFEEVLVAA